MLHVHRTGLGCSSDSVEDREKLNAMIRSMFATHFFFSIQ